MSTSFGALCSDFYVNQKVALKMDLPAGREPVLELFDRVRRSFPRMDRFRRFEEELALESAEGDAQYSWLSLNGNSIRSGWVNPETVHDAYRLHQLVLELMPFYLTVSPIDVEFIELVFGFDLIAETNRSEVVINALLGRSPLADLIGGDLETPLDAQPFIGLCLNEDGTRQAFIEVKPRTRAEEIASGHYDAQPISVYLTVRQCGPIRALEELAATFGTLAGYAERLAEERVVPHIVIPLRETILSNPR
ncbi:MAG: hypothetical protein EA377_08810 [Phycisphaerales bacterium]|nr:MAG: hypothetical protein EA377_08810 [Phycisphaerales bacterium]